MKPILTLPCKNKHSDMEKQEKGYHCKSCDHVLTDFRNLSEEELKIVLQTNTGKICGVFNRDQIDFKVSQVQVPTFRAVGLSLLGILGFLGPVLTSCESDPAATEHKQNAFNLLKFPMHVRGSVKDEKTGKPLPFFEVEVLQHNQRIKSVKTDKDGNFDILIQKDDLNQEVFKLAIGGNTIEQRDTITTNLMKFRDKKVRLTLKAEAVTEIHTLGFIPPKIIECTSIEGMMVDEPIVLEGIPAMDPIAPQAELPDTIQQPEVIRPDSIIHCTYNSGKKNKIKEKKDKKKDKTDQDSIR